jgi:hypothetical protein
LRVFVRPYFAWDALRVTLYFARVPSADEQEAFRKLVEAWGTIGSYGGLGGEGIRHLRDIRMDRATESMSFYADMGDAEEPQALSLLIRVLEGFDGVLPIEAVVFGMGPDDPTPH